MNSKENMTAEPVFAISRVFDAPREMVWEAFTGPERLKQWWGPKEFPVTVSTMDFRAGGIYHYCLRSPDGKDMWGKFAYREIMALEKIVLVSSFSDEEGGVTKHPLSPSWPLQMLSEFMFAEEKGKAKLTIRWSPLAPTPLERQTFEDGMAAMDQGWSETIDQLAGYLLRAKNQQ